MFSLARVLLTIAFLFWSLLLLGGSGLVGWIGDGLSGLLTQIHLGWLASAAAGLGKALILIVWIASAIVYAVFFAMTGQISRAVQASVKAAQQSTDHPDTRATVTLERAPDGSYR
jgi:hypothetical protein